jgi:hypothetical protein
MLWILHQKEAIEVSEETCCANWLWGKVGTEKYGQRINATAKVDWNKTIWNYVENFVHLPLLTSNGLSLTRWWTFGYFKGWEIFKTNWQTKHVLRNEFFQIVWLAGWLVNYVKGKGKGKGKADPLQAWSGPEGSRKLRFPDYLTTARDCGKVVSLTHRPPLPPGNAPGSHFC